MHGTTQRLSFIALVAVLVTAAYAVDYFYISDCEITVFNGGISFWHGDTCAGPVHSNYQISMGADPVFYDLVTQAGQWDYFACGPGCDPVFLGPPPIFHAQPVEIPELLCYYREHATRYYNPGFDKQMRCQITGTDVTLWTWDKGIAFDSAAYFNEVETFLLDTSEVIIFTETPLELMGTDITGDVTICSASLVRLMDDVRVGGPTSGPPQYRVFQGNPNFVTIASEGDIKIANTPANGRENSAGLGNAQTNPDLSDIVITAALYALGNTNVNGSAGSFTFENQNDLDSGYVFESSPDDRGQIFLYGSIAQRRRGYMHRSNNSSTGYLKQYVWDERLRTRPERVVGNHFLDGTTDTLFFGEVRVDSTVWDTAYVNTPCHPSELGVPLTGEPYAAVRISPYNGMHFRVPVSFHPPHVGNFPGMLQVQTSYRLFQIPLRGFGIPGGGPQGTGPDSLIAHLSSLIAFPNPFNAVTVFTLAIPRAGHVSLNLFDITGRVVGTILDGQMSAGMQRITFDARDLPSGVYFARLEAVNQIKTVKILLVK